MSIHDDAVTSVQVAFVQEMVEFTSETLLEASILTIFPGRVLLTSIPSITTYDEPVILIHSRVGVSPKQDP